MHCVLSYPTKDEDANLHMITSIKNNFPEYEIGYSDHTKPDTKREQSRRKGVKGTPGVFGRQCALV